MGTYFRRKDGLEELIFEEEKLFEISENKILSKFSSYTVSKIGNRYTLVFQDYLTKWPEVYAVADHKATDVMWKHGVPSQIIHDRAAEFLSDVVQEAAQVLGVKQLPISGGHPQTDGLVERLNRTFKQILSKV